MGEIRRKHRMSQISLKLSYEEKKDRLQIYFREDTPDKKEYLDKNQNIICKYKNGEIIGYEINKFSDTLNTLEILLP